MCTCTSIYEFSPSRCSAPLCRQRWLAGELGLHEAVRQTLRDADTERLTHIMRIAGNAMSPTLNYGVAAGGLGESLLVRKLRPTPDAVFVGDVVAFVPPSEAAARPVLVRRIAALEGQDMESTDPEQEDFRRGRIPHPLRTPLRPPLPAPLLGPGGGERQLRACWPAGAYIFRCVNFADARSQGNE